MIPSGSAASTCRSASLWALAAYACVRERAAEARRPVAAALRPSSRRWRGSSGSRISACCEIRTPTARPISRISAADAIGQARVRRRAALAIGRVGLASGVAPLVHAARRRRARSAADGGVRARPDRRPAGARPAGDGAGRPVAARAGQRRRSARAHRRSCRSRSRSAGWSRASSSRARWRRRRPKTTRRGATRRRRRSGSASSRSSGSRRTISSRPPCSIRPGSRA